MYAAPPLSILYPLHLLFQGWKHDTPKKRKNSSPGINPALKEIYEIPEREFKLMIVRNVNVTYGNTDSLKKWGEKIGNMSEIFMKEMRIIKKKQKFWRCNL